MSSAAPASGSPAGASAGGSAGPKCGAWRAATGRVYINLPNIYWWRYVLRAWRRGEGPDHFQPNEAFLPRAEWQRLIEQNGLRILRVETWRPRVVLNPLRPLLVAGSLVENLVPPNLANCFGFLATPRA